MKCIFLLDCMRNHSCTHPDTLCHRILNPFSLASPADILRRASRVPSFVGKERVTHALECLRGRLHSPLILVFICVFGFPLEFADSTCRFFCSIYFAEQFRLLRKRIFADGEEKYELHFVIYYMNRSYGTRKLLYSLIPWTPIPRPGERWGRGYTPEDF